MGYNRHIFMQQYYGKPCDPSCYNYQKCEYCRPAGFGRTCGDKLFCSVKFYCKYAHYSVNTPSTKECQWYGVN